MEIELGSISPKPEPEPKRTAGSRIVDLVGFLFLICIAVVLIMSTIKIGMVMFG